MFDLLSLRQPVLVIGGTRGTGLLIVQRLALDGVPVRVLARNPERAKARLGHSFGRAKRLCRTFPFMTSSGVLLNRRGGVRGMRLTQAVLPLSFRFQIARADVADAFVAALRHPGARNATFDIVWGPGDRQASWTRLLNTLHPDIPVDASPLVTRG